MDRIPSGQGLTWQFVRGRDLSSTLIAWFGGGAFSHVDCVLPDGTLLGSRSDAIGGKPPGVQIRPPEYDTWVERALITLRCSDHEAQLFHDFLLAQVGKPYDSAAIFGFILGRNWASPDSYICSELQCSGLEVAGIVGRLYLTANRITPNDLTLILTALGGQPIKG